MYGGVVYTFMLSSLSCFVLFAILLSLHLDKFITCIVTITVALLFKVRKPRWLCNDYNALHILQVATALQVGDRPVVGL